MKRRMSLIGLLLALPLAAGGDEARGVLDACDDPVAWSGGTLDAGLKVEGAGSIRWAHAERAQLDFTGAPRDWTVADGFRFMLHSEVATGSSFMIILVSENPVTEGMDYWMARVTLDFVGWRQINVARRGMGQAREPRGWDQIDRVFLTAAGWEQQLDPRAVVRLDQWEWYDVVGPRLTDAELFALLDPAVPGLAPAVAAAEAGDHPAARAALARYLRERTIPVWWFEPHQINREISFNRAEVERTMRGEFQVITVWHTFPDGEIDWFYNPTKARADLAANNEWQWQLGRMHFWYGLGAAYWATGDEQYAETFVRQLRSWVRGCPRPDQSGNTADSAWRTIECGIRMGGSWPTAFCRFLLSPSFTDDDIILYLKAAVEHANHLTAHRTSGNWLTMEMSGLFAIGVLFPELLPASDWRQTAAQALYREADAQFLPDGSQIELTPGYHQVALDNVLAIPRLADRVGRSEELPAGYVAACEKAYDFNLRLMTPDRDLPRFNDSWPVNVTRSLARAVELFGGRDDFRWVATGGREGQPPAFTSVPLPHAGYNVMRSGWETDANYAVLDVGPLGYGHVHQDKLNLVLWAFGREILFDGGGGSYENSIWRRYGVDTFSHNTVLVDGLPQRRDTRDRQGNVAWQPIDAPWESHPGWDFTAGTYDEGYGEVGRRVATHHRRVVYLKPDLFLVTDTLDPVADAPHRYQARWHLLTESSRHDESLGQVTTTDANQPNLVVVPLLVDGLAVQVASQQREPELLGWNIVKDSGPIARPATTVTHTRTGPGRQRFCTLLLPLRAGETSPLAAVRVEADGQLRVDLTDGRSLLIRLADDPLAPDEIREMLPGGAAGRTTTR